MEIRRHEALNDFADVDTESATIAARFNPVRSMVSGDSEFVTLDSSGAASIPSITTAPRGATRAGLVTSLWITAAGSAVIAVVLWILVPAIDRYDLRNLFVKSESIGLSVCLMIYGLRLLSERCGKISPRFHLLLIPVLSVSGLVIGMLMARLILLGITGEMESPLRGFDDRQEFITTVATTVLATTLFLWYFSTREEVGRLKLAAVEQAQRASDAKLAMLRAQVEPHMLFNTLANLRALIPTDPERATEMLDQLIPFLRATLDGSRYTMRTLSHEFAVLENYLTLMQIRLGSRLQFTLELPESLSAQPVPALLIQPLVENAIRHGIEPALSGGSIMVKAQHDVINHGDEVIISVLDTGVGLSTQILNLHATKLRADQQSSSVVGFGLGSLRDRLQSHYGQAATLAIDSPPPGLSAGTLITVRLPLQDPSNAEPIAESGSLY